MANNAEMLSRSAMLLGQDAMLRLGQVRVIVFGIGGVGSWCAEALVRTGVKHITIVDCDIVAPSNVNRQLMATAATLGRSKVEAMHEHLVFVSPEAEIVARQEVYTSTTADSFCLDDYDYVIDAIDSVPDKVLLIQRATRSRATLFSSMGAACKLDPQQVRVAEFWKVQGCPLARALRNHFKRSGERPARKFQCVYSPERLDNLDILDNLDNLDGRGKSINAEGITSPSGRERSVNGSLLHITGIFGFTLASLVIRDIVNNSNNI